MQALPIFLYKTAAPPHRRAASAAISLLSGAALAAVLLTAADQALAQTAATRSRAPVAVNFVNAEVDAVTRAFSAMLGRSIVVDPRVRGTMTVFSEQPQSIAEAYASYVSALRGLGFSVVETGGLLKVVPEADAKLQTGTVAVDEVPRRGGQVITQIFTLRHENPNNLVAVLRPLISANNTINANPGSNSLIITDYADNLQRIGKIIAALDLPAGTDIDIVPLKHAVAADIAALVQRLSETSLGPSSPGVPAGGSGSVTVVAEPRSNALILRAPNAVRLAQLRATVALLDRPSNLLGPEGGMWVVHLKNADAEKLATVVRAAFAAVGTGGGGSISAVPAAQPGQPTNAATRGTSASALPSTGGMVQANPATNSLIITAPEPLYRQMRSLIDQLDGRRAQVYIESMIVEVSPSDAADFGFQWQGLLGKAGDKVGLVAGTNFSASGRPSIIDINTSAATGAVNIGSGLNLGLLTVINGVTSLSAIAKLLQTQSDTNIISTPNLITLDNEEAKIVVGENVPFITGQFTTPGSTGATANPFQTIERKDVGITLRIKPQVGEGGAVRMTIFQEQSSVKETTAAGTTNAGPSTTKRSIENTVVVDDGAILVLGGLIEDRFVTTKSKVPLLGDLPFVGALFRSESRERKRTNMIVFLRPVVLRDAESASRLTMDRYDQIRGEQKASQPAQSSVLGINESPVLPPLRPPQAPTTPPPLGSAPMPRPESAASAATAASSAAQTPMAQSSPVQPSAAQPTPRSTP